jgi:hypothetical protein
MNSPALSISSALASTVCYALAAICQERAAVATTSETPDEERALSVRRTFGVAGWWHGVALNCIGGALHVVALRFGSLTVVQLIGTLTLVLALPLRALINGERITSAERRGGALTASGLLALFLTTEPAATTEALTRPELRLVTGLCALSIGALIIAGPTRWAGAFRFAAASGIAFAGASILSQTLAVDLTDRKDLPGFYIVVGMLFTALLSIAGLLLIQAAYRSGLGVPLAVQTITNPTVAAAVGLLLLGEHFRGGLIGLVSALVAGGVVARGIILLSHPAGQASEPVPLRTADSHPADDPATHHMPLSSDQR